MVEDDIEEWRPQERAQALPCPFCGNAPTVEERYVDTGSGDGATHYSISCERHEHMTVEAGALGVHGYPRQDDPADDAAARAAVLKAWNTRAPSAGKRNPTVAT